MDTQSSVSEVESDTSSTSCSATPAPSLLDRLKAPQKSQLARKRAIKTNSGRFYKRHTIPSTKSDPKSVSPAERVSQHKDEPFTVSAGKHAILKHYRIGQLLPQPYYSFNPLQQQRSVFFRYISPLLEINKKPHFRTILKHHLCCSLMDSNCFIVFCIILYCVQNFKPNLVKIGA